MTLILDPQRNCRRRWRDSTIKAESEGSSLGVEKEGGKGLIALGHPFVMDVGSDISAAQIKEGVGACNPGHTDGHATQMDKWQVE